MNINLEQLYTRLTEIVAVFGIKLLSALIILIAGMWIAKQIRGIVERVMGKSDNDPILISFVSNLVYIAAVTFVAIAALAQLGIQTTSFIAVLGAAGLAVGLALQGSLSNFASGVLMIIFRPFKVGDFIDAAGTMGVVKEIQIFSTILTTPDNKKVIVPNASITGGNITNFSAMPTRRLDLTFGIGYEDDIDKAKSLIEQVIAENNKILTDPAPTIGISELADSSVNFAVWIWVAGADYFDVMFYMNETVKKRFDAEGISIPFPQQDVYVKTFNNNN
ncbi:MscS Mechanosensitive ion channel [Thalassoporum mexicanum PCC 7367]|uniref:mechanosensitive ion channel family protein n=1 Tax=Thalassoporum mexicanum TaxID=3457544 RepID=UPI00029FE180|nr:mechanosensitive ion channel domain-containing protein [Pseudanabaena sp. PCC 7367]AFY71742.1 MscS Mechanosensitive ion channel [Pseudanabaena sp. PCC 7367]